MLRHLKTKHSSVAAKPADFFRRKERAFQSQKKVMTNQKTISAEAQKASYEVAYLIAQATKNPHTIGEILIKPAAIAMSQIMHGDKQAQELKAVPRSDGTISRRITEMAQDQGQVRWLSRGNVLRRLFELRDEVCLFLLEHGSHLAAHLTDPDWLTRLAYLACIFDKLNGLNTSLQVENANIMSLNDKIDAFKRKLDRWCARVKTGCFDIFPELEEFMEENDLCVNSMHLQTLLDHFIKFFPEETAPEKYDWIRCPFTVTSTHHLSSDIEDALVELSSDRTLKSAFNSKMLAEFWISVEREYPQLVTAIDILTPFGSTYLCEKTFSTLTYIKNKYRSRLNVQDDLRVAISKIKPRMDLLGSKHIAHPSHTF
uniref:HAT C-terminal dimerisation domain-containing protein n=1 Tax=Nothobranchius kadleci TaxID=1051664 RepID=A0A1A8DU23_NOTKA